MPPLIVAVLVGAAAYAGFRAAKQVWTQVTAPPQSPSPGQSSDRTTEGMGPEKDLGKLEYDAASGVYRPSRPQ